MRFFPANQRTNENNLFFIVASGLLFVAYLLGLFVFPMDIDSAQYAAMSMEMWQNKSFLEITNMGKPYLDKPPLIFWLSSLSMGVFGFHAWAFKLPTLLSTILGAYSTYHLANKLWNCSTARLALLILSSSVAWLVFNNDVRTDALLANFVIFSCWQFVEWYLFRKNIHLVGVGVGTALAMLAKGPIAAVAVGVWVTSWLIFHRDWKTVFHFRWILVVMLIIIMLLPMCWGLYHQHGFEGIRFYFWTQSFGRITGDSEWVNHPGIGYFLPVLAWSFLPWAPLFVLGIFVSIRKNQIWGAAENTLSISSLVLFAALSLSRYKLPHYIFIILPWLSLLTARFVSQPHNIILKRFSSVFTLILLGLCAIAVPVLSFTFLSSVPALLLVFWTIAVLIIMGLFLRRKDAPSTLALLMAVIFIVLNGWLYPYLLTYQGTSVIGNMAREKEITPDKIRVIMEYPVYALAFSYQHVPRGSDPRLLNEELKVSNYLWVICDEPRLNYMKEIGIQITKKFQANHYPVTRLNPAFIPRHSRVKHLRSIYLCKVTRDSSL